MSEIQCVVQGLFGELRAAIEELLLPGAEAEQRDALRTFDFRRSIYKALPRGPGHSADDADWIIRRP